MEGQKLQDSADATTSEYGNYKGLPQQGMLHSGWH